MSAEESYREFLFNQPKRLVKKAKLIRFEMKQTLLEVYKGRWRVSAPEKPPRTVNLLLVS